MAKSSEGVLPVSRWVGSTPRLQPALAEVPAELSQPERGLRSRSGSRAVASPSLVLEQQHRPLAQKPRQSARPGAHRAARVRLQGCVLLWDTKHTSAIVQQVPERSISICLPVYGGARERTKPGSELPTSQASRLQDQPVLGDRLHVLATEGLP